MPIFNGAHDNLRPRCTRPILYTSYARSRRYEQLRHEQKSQTQSGLSEFEALPSTVTYTSITTSIQRRVSFRLQHQHTVCDPDPAAE
ncbi:hypothetical protein GGP41_000060 [Bipolaris sorokiniana]|uniref:Uncharacterized protein n=1 Tax=Cochliobolus sativus TaxID=45130 RepID=A0A8H5ZDT3_COCSA|nr:hypothetical protein GGP41_000060 [Bipolaris sorokiniana]